MLYFPSGNVFRSPPETTAVWPMETRRERFGVPLYIAVNARNCFAEPYGKIFDRQHWSQRNLDCLGFYTHSYRLIVICLARIGMS